MTHGPCDVFVIGGGINGCGIARDAAGRGYSVMLAEMNDLASGTSSAATKLVHGGLRYLEHFEFRLVAESLAEREVLWAIAPHLVRPMRFVLPHHRGLRPAFVLRAGLLLYDSLGGRKLLPPTKTLDLERDEAGAPLRPGFRTGFEYSDCWVDDARMVVANARDAADRGARIATRTKVVSARRIGSNWEVGLEDTVSGECSSVEAKLLVNAAGPWIDDVLARALGRSGARRVRLVKGSHIVVRRHFDHARSYIFQNADGRIIFAIPYEDDFTLIGTTDEDFAGDPADVAISESETAYLCRAASNYFRDPVTPDAIVWTYSGVRPLFDDGASAAQEATRDYVLKTDGGGADPTLVNVFGGKLTTYRRLAEEVLERVESALGTRGKPWTSSAKLPGGGFAAGGFESFVAGLVRAHSTFPEGLLRRYARLYGSGASEIIGDAASASDLGEEFGAGLTAREVDHLVANEWARTTDDILWRRTKLGLRLDAAARERLEAYLHRGNGKA